MPPWSAAANPVETVDSDDIIYLDYAATTPVDPAVLDAMQAVQADSHYYGNPSSLHAAGRRSFAVIEEARDPGTIYRPVPLWWWDGDDEAWLPMHLLPSHVAGT